MASATTSEVNADPTKRNTKVTPKDPPRSPKLKPMRRNSSRAAPQHDFIVANMFGPVDWDHEWLADQISEVEMDSKREIISEANMYGPMDWALDIKFPENSTTEEEKYMIETGVATEVHEDPENN